MIHEIVTLLSLALTPATVIASIAVTVIWFQSAKTAIYTKHKTEMHWLLLGVFFSFIGAIVDNTYWGLAWSADYINSEHKETLFKHGVYSNLPFRQMTTLLAAYCHVRAAVASDSALLRTTIASGWFFGIGLTVFLYVSAQ